ncbi:uncharacterized protein LOC8264641 isoform X2 [Ricinus communis]|uniref:uncharacterized protein LOC8264641 isoform X2 n=1 Tax=Ricinus communis TaxID=3988 RepID=UPI00201A7E2E|nr:uncharacterized protein LOC8264641 isoform X2 [Ricinus communis]
MVIGASEQCKGLYYLKTVTSACKASRVDVFELWHKRMGHPSKKAVELLPNVNSNSIDSVESKPCDVCFRAKQTRKVFLSSDNKANEIFELIHCDLWGPYRVVSSCGASYFLTIVDDFSRGVWIYLLIDKTEVENVLCNFLVMVKRQFNKEVKVVRSDNGTEFTRLNNYFDENGIMHQTSCVGTPQQHGRIERKHRHVLNVARALRFQANLPIKFWDDFPYARKDMTHSKQDVSSLGCVDIMDQVNDDVFDEEGSVSVTPENPVQVHDDMNNVVKGGTTVLVDGYGQQELGRGLRTKCPST